MEFEIQKNVSLKEFNTFGIDVKAKYFVTLTELKQLKDLYESKYWSVKPRMILGGGSNILFLNDFEGLVVKVDLKGIEISETDSPTVYIKAGAGENWHNLVEFAIQKGLAGIENLSLIPGQVGAAPMQNIGAYGVELESCFVDLEAFDMENGTFVTFDKEACKFGYRESVFKNVYKNRFIITSVRLKLSKVPSFKLDYGAIKETLNEMQVEEISIKKISDAVIKIRQSKLPDPAVLHNAGSFFKNPLVEDEKFKKLIKQFPDMPYYEAEKNLKKIPAGWLIDNAGLKGYRKKSVGIHQKQALVIVNYGGAEGKEVFDFSQFIVDEIKAKYGIKLEREVNIVE
ncbi:MAG: UDP-N-acetylmuramate dehydrogenase [Chitinophagaceae bacterium]|nr:MAG: UDP-N-acetylmuramate dehydrogenase [Chitinophagaceae bacterium]